MVREEKTPPGFPRAPLALGDFDPPSLGGRLDFLFFEKSTDRDRSPLVKEDEHQRVRVEEGALSRPEQQIQ
jgi:hypothetical protein